MINNFQLYVIEFVSGFHDISNRKIEKYKVRNVIYSLNMDKECSEEKIEKYYCVDCDIFVEYDDGFSYHWVPETIRCYRCHNIYKHKLEKLGVKCGFGVVQKCYAKPSQKIICQKCGEPTCVMCGVGDTCKKCLCGCEFCK